MKQPYELLPHQYAQQLHSKVRWHNKITNEEGIIRYVINPSYRLYRGAVEVLLGRKPYEYNVLQKVAPSIDDINTKAEEIRIEHAKHVYLAIKAGIKIKGNILRAIPDLIELAELNEWYNLPVPDLKPKDNKPKDKKAIPKRDDPEDNLRENFSKEDKKDSWY